MKYRAGMAVVAAVGLVACGKDKKDSAPPLQPLTAETAGDAASGLTGDVTSAIGAFDGSMFSGGFDMGLAVPNRSRLPLALRNLLKTTSIRLVEDDCFVMTGDPDLDTDSDGVPDDVTITADPAVCTFTEDGGTWSYGGVIHIQDLNNAAADFAFTYEIIGLEITAVMEAQGQEFHVTMDALHSGSVAAGVYTLVQDYTFAANIVAEETTITASADVDWVVTYTPEGGTWVPGEDGMAAGDLTIDGDWSYSYNGAGAAATIATPTAIHFDPSCMSDERITAGHLQASWEQEGSTASIDVEWSACDTAVTTFNGTVIENT